MKWVLPSLVAALCAGNALAAPAKPAAAPNAASITVEASQIEGLLKPFRGVNGVPDMSYLPPSAAPEAPAAVTGAQAPQRPADVSAGYRAARVNMIRTHDAQGAGDVDSNMGSLPALRAEGRPVSNSMVIFPDLSADPSDPKNYNFGPTDKMIAGIYKAGAEPLFRLGRSGRTTAEAPKDPVRYAEIIRHIVMHYNKGWANGFEYNIRHWEVWNEPDLGQTWWRGTAEEYYKLYAAAAAAIKSADDSALVGGPTLAFVNEPTPFREGFLQYARDNKLPLDFFAWHYYSMDANDPMDFVRISQEMRSLLDRYGFTKTPSFLDEWNYGLGEQATPIHRAAFVATSLLYMQDAPIDRELFYRADRSFGADGKTPDKVGQVLVAMGRLADTPVRLKLTGADDKGLAAVAGRSADGQTINVVISNYQIPAEDIGPRKGRDEQAMGGGTFKLALLPRRTVVYDRNQGFGLTVKGLDPKAAYAIERYRTSATSDFALVEKVQKTGDKVMISSDLAAPGIELLVIKRVAAASAGAKR